MRLRSLPLIALCLLSSASAFAQKSDGGAKSPAEEHDKKVATEIADNWVSAPVQEVTKTREQKTGTLAYTSTAGTLTIRDAAGKPIASIFYTAYTMPAAGKRRR